MELIVNLVYEDIQHFTGREMKWNPEKYWETLARSLLQAC